MIKLVVFDLDGTLVDSVCDLADSVNFILSKNGYPINDTDKYYKFVGDGTLKLVERALKGKTDDKKVIMRLHDEFLAYYSEHCLDKTRAYDGIYELLKNLNKMNVMISVASNKTDVFTKEIVSKLFEEIAFSDVSGKKEGVPKKPDPQIVFDIMNYSNVKPFETLYVGDSDVDVQTGHNAGLLICGCEWGFRGREELLNAGSDFIVKYPKEIISIINNLNKGEI
ncbi:MAG: HAD family hydrolase [Ruminococcus sp.]|nr:HAD family hydrolase [Ruminococcus sp.]